MYKLFTCIFFIVLSASCTYNKNESKTSNDARVKQLSSPASDSCAQPNLFTAANGLVYLSWIQKKGKESTLLFSTLMNKKWAQPIVISSGNNWFVNWADYPVISADTNGHILTHFLEKSDTARFTYDIKLMASADAGKTWSHPKILHDDGKKAEHGFVTIAAYKEHFFISWLDGRKTATEEKEDHHGDHHGEMTLRAAQIDKNGIKLNEWELDERICDCCQTSIANTENGPVVIYRDRSKDEIRDMSIVRFVNGEWTKPKTIFADQWKIAGCPVNGPRADAIGNHLAIAWFTMQENKAQVKIIFSDDGGATFKDPIQIDEGKPIGRVDVVMLNENTAMISWMEGSTIKALKINTDGTRGKPIIIAESSDSRTSGFPQMTKAGNQLIFAWTDSKEKTIKLASFQL